MIRSAADLLLLAAEAAGGSTLLPVAAALAARVWPRSAARRRLVWCAAFVALLPLPLAAATLPSLWLIRTEPSSTWAARASPMPAPTLLAQVAALAALAWLAGVLFNLARGLGGALALEGLRRRSAPAEGWLALAPSGAEVRLSPDQGEPMTWGVLRPVILLPASAAGWSPTMLDAVLRHEQAHVRRRDSVIQVMAMAACALYWPNPLVWAADRALRREMEAAADDAVIASGVRPSDYAALLLEVARRRKAGPGRHAALAMAAPAALSRRIACILSPDASRSGATLMDLLKLTAAGSLAVAGLALARPSLAEDPARARPPAAETPATARPLAAAAPAPAAPHAPAAAPRPPAARETRPLAPEDQAALKRRLGEIGPVVSKAIADAHIDVVVRRQLQAGDAEARAEMERQLAELGPRIRKALDDAQIDAVVARALAEVQPRIEEALARAEPGGKTPPSQPRPPSP